VGDEAFKTGTRMSEVYKCSDKLPPHDVPVLFWANSQWCNLLGGYAKYYDYWRPMPPSPEEYFKSIATELTQEAEKLGMYDE
jgi:hypothetical protein